VLTLSSFETRTFVEAGVDPEKIVQIPPGVDVQLFRPAPRAEDGVYRILFVGQLTQRKGLSYLFDGFERAGLPQAEILLVGQRLGPLPPRERVRVTRAVAQSRLPPIYATADVFVMPSIVEGSCLTALEAMACGLPVIVSEHTGTNDLIKDGREGFVVPIRDPDAIAERLRVLHADPDRRRDMGRAARARAEQYTWRRYGDRVTEALAA